MGPRGRSVHGRSCSGAFTSDEAPAQRWAFEVDAMGAMDEAVENGVGIVGSPNTARCHNSGTTATQNPGHRRRPSAVRSAA